MAKRINICPKCASTDIVSDQTNAADIQAGILPLHCNSCGYTNPVFPKVPPDKVEEFRQTLRVKVPDQPIPQVDITAGKGYLGAIRAFIVIFMLGLALIFFAIGNPAFGLSFLGLGILLFVIFYAQLRSSAS